MLSPIQGGGGGTQQPNPFQVQPAATRETQAAAQENDLRADQTVQATEEPQPAASPNETRGQVFDITA